MSFELQGSVVAYGVFAVVAECFAVECYLVGGKAD